MWATWERFRTAVRAGLPEWPWAPEVEVKRPDRPEEVAQAALFLLSDEARFIPRDPFRGWRPFFRGLP